MTTIKPTRITDQLATLRAGLKRIQEIARGVAAAPARTNSPAVAAPPPAPTTPARTNSPAVAAPPPAPTTPALTGAGSVFTIVPSVVQPIFDALFQADLEAGGYLRAAQGNLPGDPAILVIEGHVNSVKYELSHAMVEGRKRSPNVAYLQTRLTNVELFCNLAKKAWATANALAQSQRL